MKAYVGRKTLLIGMLVYIPKTGQEVGGESDTINKKKENTEARVDLAVSHCSNEHPLGNGLIPSQRPLTNFLRHADSFEEGRF